MRPNPGSGGKAKPKPKTPPKVAGQRSSGASRSADRQQPTGWTADLLGRLGAPVTAENVRFLNAWAQAEGSRASFNPLNTTQNAPGASAFNSVGVRNYTSYEQGLDATVKTLRNGYYGGILSALKSGDSAERAAQAVAASPWGTGSLVLKVLGSGGGDSAPQIAGVGKRGMSAPIGGGGSDTSGYNLGPDATTLDPKELASEFGYAAAFYNSDPSLKALIDRAVKEHWDPKGNRFTAELMGTDWYKTHTAAQRKWTQLVTSDPAEAKAQQVAMGKKLTSMASQMGASNISSARLWQMAGDALKFGWDDTQVQHALASEWRWSYGTAANGQAGQVVDNFRQEAQQYLVPLSDQTIGTWTRKVLAGDASPSDWQDYLKTQAKSLFPSLAKQIDAGLTVDQYLDPYKQTAAQMLEVNPNSINWLDPKWSQAVFQTDPTTGQRGPMSVSQWQTTLRTDPKYGFDQTGAARQDAAALSSKIQQLMGALG